MSGGISSKDIYQALVGAGASTNQAIGIMANMIAESNLDVEMHGYDTNGYMAYGLVSWNSQYYPDAGSLVTGNPQADLQAQVSYLRSTGAFQKASGSTPQEAAGNFAAIYEGCQGCNPGSNYPNGWQTRVNNADTVLGWLKSGNWKTSGGTSGGGGGGGGPVTTSSNPNPAPPGVNLMPNPFWDIWNTIFGNPSGGIIQSPTTQPAPLAGLTGIGQALITIAEDITKMFQWLSWLFNPSSWLRIGAFIFGALCFGAGLYMLKEAI